jgi:hypothetical protein
MSHHRVWLTAADLLNPSKTRVSTPSPCEKWLYVSVTPWSQSENLGFSTFFSTVVENFGGRPYGNSQGGDSNTGLSAVPNAQERGLRELTLRAEVGYYRRFLRRILRLSGILTP